MDTGRLEAFSDGVIAVIITIMVLDLRIPHGTDLRSLAPDVPVFLTYILSFVNVGIYWNNHHHLLHATRRINGRIMWANLHLLFWLSLIPFTTGWAGENHLSRIPTLAYGLVLLMCALAYVVLQSEIIRFNATDSEIGIALGSDWKGKVSLASYVVSLPIALIAPTVSAVIFVAVAALWFVPDRRLERVGAD
jgi:uncharacterized membrane protein